MEEENGILSIIKPVGWTSMDVVRMLKRLTKQKRVGHAGTLDPRATGLLPICFGQATRVMEYLVDSPKTYMAVIELGVSTDSYDAAGQVTSIAETSLINTEDIESALDKYKGTFNQVPPMFSALKKEGKRLYKLARAGKEVDRPPREVSIYKMDMLDWSQPNVTLEIQCGRGMYVRSLAHDIGVDLGCGAHLSQLDRIKTGPFDYSTALDISKAEKVCTTGDWISCLYPIDFPLMKLRSATVSPHIERAIRQKQAVYLNTSHCQSGASHLCRVYSSEGDLIAIAEPSSEGGNMWRAKKLFNAHLMIKGT